ncbi:putative defense protein 3 [Ruditapes philippinarum]|uniref:putative defense protein 3 n=1 Tax=Ruditapes philippinarum TaxID=129788 RepID=UPI00295C03A0|nr:putative defense protein 3 [Ruditapes philippinarum]XP_060591629.1 putative defense protein 3 [Ruditapes philippinarum]
MAIAMSMLGIWLLTAVQLCFVEAYPTGAPSGACEAMIPGHTPSVPQTGDSLYDIKLSSVTYCPKTEVTVTIMGKSNNGEKFRGFLCQARTAVNTYETSGSLTSTGTKNDCSGKASLSHADRTDKTSAVLKWTPNEGFTSSAFIVCTIVKEKTTFWVKQNVELTYAGAANCTDNMGVCNKDEDCSGMEGKQCVDGKCTSGAMRTVLVSLVLMVVCFVLTHF